MPEPINVRVSVIYRFTGPAAAELGKNPDFKLKFWDADPAMIPLPGDHFSVTELLPHEFIVTQRNFHWDDQATLQVTVHLDLA